MTSVAFKFRSLIGTDRKHWPVTVRKYELMSDGFEEKTDRGRRVHDPDTDEPVYEFLNENSTTTPIPKKYLKWDSDGNRLLEVLKVQTDEGPMYAPIEKRINVDAEDFEDLENREEVGVDLVVKLSRFINIGKKEIERHYEITKQDEKAWYEQPMFLMVSGFIGLGIFLILGGIAYSKMINEQVLKEINNLSYVLPVAASGIRERVKKWHG